MSDNTNLNNQPEKESEGSLVLQQIQSKDSEVQKKQSEKKSIFQTLTTPSGVDNPPPKNSSVRKPLPILGILGGVIFLFLLFIVLMVVVIVMGGDNSALLIAFNIDESQLKSVLQTVVNLSFGFVAFVALIFFVITAFRLSLSKKEEKEKRKSIFKHILISLIILLFSLGFWFGIYRVVTQMKLDIPLSQLKIVTTPDDLSNLTAPFDVNFDASQIITSLNSRGLKPQRIGWDFDGDGTYDVYSETEMSLQRRFEQEGKINVGLIVYLSNGTEQKFSKLLNITQAEFSVSTAEGFAPLNVKFNASALERRESPASSFDWDFDGDGVFDQKNTKPSTEFTFEKIGVYNVKLRIIDTKNTVRNYSKKIEVLRDNVQRIEAKIAATPVSGLAPLKVGLDASESASIDSEIKSYEWDIGDGSGVLYGRRVSYTYKTPGKYLVSLLVIDQSGQKDRATQEIEVIKTFSAPVAKINTDFIIPKGTATLEGVIPFTVKFNGSSSEDSDNNIVEYSWDFNNDKVFEEYGEVIQYTFEQEGEYKITLKVEDADGQSSTADLMVKTRQRDLQAILEADPLSGPLPLKVNFNASTSVYKKGKIVTYEWNFGDGGETEYGDAQRTHIYDREGRFVVKLKAYTDDGNTTETQKEIYVRAVQLQACFSAKPLKGKAPLVVQFDSSCSKGEVAKWRWDFGDGLISTSHSPVHTFSQSGEYTVSLELVDSKNNSSSFESIITVFAE